MDRRSFMGTLGACLISVAAARSAVARPIAGDDSYLSWSADRAESIAKSTRQSGKVGSRNSIRLLKTERAVNYKMIATWLTPDVIRATARWLQLRNRLSADQTRALVAEAEAAGDTIFMVELDPREGSGVIPDTWECYLQARGAAPDAGRSARGVSQPRLRDVQALQGVERRNYDYDRFWVAMPLVTASGEPVFGPSDREAELIVRVYSQEEHTYWPVPESIRGRMPRHQSRSR
jgi:hypothetical protein